MGLELIQKKEDPKSLIINWEGEVWRKVSKPLFFSELRKFPSDLSKEAFTARFSQLEEKVAQRHAIWLLAKKTYLEADLEAKLRQKGISPAVAQKAIAFCCAKGYLDDGAQMKRLFAKASRKGQSAKATYFKLKTKVDGEYLDAHFQEASSQDEEVLKAYLEKNKSKIAREGKEKWAAKLYRRGFSQELILRFLRVENGWE